MKGRSLLPFCHFELEESDYITGGRRNPELRGPWGAAPGTMLNPNTKVIEFQSCGVKVKVTRYAGSAVHRLIFLKGSSPEHAYLKRSEKLLSDIQTISLNAYDTITIHY